MKRKVTILSSIGIFVIAIVFAIANNSLLDYDFVLLNGTGEEIQAIDTIKKRQNSLFYGENFNTG